MLGHILSEEQSKDGSDRASNDGHLTIVQCHHYHQPPLSDLYWSSVRILPPLRYCYDFDQFRLYSHDRIQSVSDNAQAFVQGAS